MTAKWSGGEIDGAGTATYPNGDIYEGSFEGGKTSGPRHHAL